MTTHGSATVCQQAPHGNRTTRTATIINALKRRAQAVLNDSSLDPQSRAIIRYAMETQDPWLAELVRRADQGEGIIGALDFSQAPDTTEDDSSNEKVTTLAEVICKSGDEPETKTAALLVLMATSENSDHTKALANTAKHLALTRCAELNLNGMVDAQVATLEEKLLANVA